jgi:ribose-phosphate pyrophosphokinase
MYAERMGGELAVIDKRRMSGSDVAVGRLIGEVKGRTVLMMDDMISTAGTVCAAAELCRREGAARILVGATHPVLCGPAVENLRKAPIDEIVVTDTIPVAQETLTALPKLRVLSVAKLIGEAVHRIHNDESVSSLFLKEGNRS